MEDKKLNETTIGSVMGSTSDPYGGFFIGPLSKVPSSVLRRRIYFKDPEVKNGDGTTGKIVEPPQGYVKENMYSVEGELINENNLNEWFGPYLNKKPSFNGGKIVAIEPKCLAFPYCSQGSVDKPIKLIGENKEDMCEDCYNFCDKIANMSGKDVNYIIKIIRDKYLSK